jgi:3-oxoisoapionate kinase
MTAAIKIGFYGDDATGASDNAAQFQRHGLHTMLFFGVPDAETLALALRNAPDVVGIAGIARSLPTARMAAEVLPALELLHRLQPKVMQYKCCSTLDSTPEIGSLGEAARLLLRLRPAAFLGVFAAMPEFGRYTVFGQHFARYGPEVFRLDRHPSMIRHPVTPAYEADIQRLFASQGMAIERLVDVRTLESGPSSAIAETLLNAPAAVLDSLTETQLEAAAATLWAIAQSRPVVAVAAQGLAHGLGIHLRRTGAIPRPLPAPRLAPADRLLVLSGSASPRSAKQIAWAAAAGFVALRVSSAAIRAGATGVEMLRPALDLLQAGRSVILYSTLGPDDPALHEVAEWQGSEGLDGTSVADRLGGLYAAFARTALAEAGVRRLVLAGGDSSSLTMRHLGASAVEMEVSHFAQNAHIGRLRATDPLLNGVQVLLKGGQVGEEDLYGVMRDGFG